MKWQNRSDIIEATETTDFFVDIFWDMNIRTPVWHHTAQLVARELCLEVDIFENSSSLFSAEACAEKVIHVFNRDFNFTGFWCGLFAIKQGSRL